MPADDQTIADRFWQAFSRFAEDAAARDAHLARLDERLNNVLAILTATEASAQRLLSRFEEETRVSIVLGTKVDEVRERATENRGRIEGLEHHFADHLAYAQLQVSRIDSLQKELDAAVRSTTALNEAVGELTDTIAGLETIREDYEARHARRGTIWTAILTDMAKAPLLILIGGLSGAVAFLLALLLHVH